MATPKKGVAYTFSMSLVDTANPAFFKVNPTIGAGDFQVSKDNGTFVNMATLPVVTPTGSILVLVSLSAAEMTANKLTIRALDAAGGEWEEASVFIDIPATNETDDDVRLALIQKILKNKLVTDPDTGLMTLFDDDDTTPLLTAPLFENTQETQAYRGRGAEVRRRLT